MSSKTTYEFAFRSERPATTSVFDGDRLLKAAMQHPFALAVLVGTVLLVLTMRFVPFLDRWASWAPWVLAWGALCFGVAALTVSRTRPTPSEPELRELESVRRMIYARIKERRSSEGFSRSAVTRTMEEAHENLEHRIMPAMAQLIALQKELTAHIQEFDEGGIASPAPDVLKRLRALHSRRDAIIKECVLQASNAAATLIEMIQEQEQAAPEEDASVWAEDLLNTYDAILEAMRPGTTVEGDVQMPGNDGPAGMTMETRPAASGLSATARPAGQQRQSNRALLADDMMPALEFALRKLNRASELTECELLQLLPVSLERHWNEMKQEATMPPTQLELALALQSLIVKEIELLKPSEGQPSSGNPAAEQYLILHEQYVRGRNVDQIYHRLFVSKRGYFTRRRAAVEALASHLATKEAFYAEKAPERSAAEFADLRS